jgi:replicative DNA helicase
VRIASFCFDGGVTDQMVSLRDVLTGADKAIRSGQSALGRVWPTGFDLLDSYLGGGLHEGELTLLGGPQGLGKTTFALQVLRNVVASGGSGLYFSFEHDAPTVLQRILAIEAAMLAGHEGAPLRRVRDALRVEDGAPSSLAERFSGIAGGDRAIEAVESYGDRLQIHRSSGASTTVDEIAKQVATIAKKDAPVVVVDYLQKVAVPDGPPAEDERVTLVVEALKDMALAAKVPVLSIVAADKAGLVAGKRLRIGHLRGSTALAYEPDVVLVLNEKFDVVARHHLVYDVGNAERFHEWAVLTIEKNRGGLGGLDLELQKRFEQGCFDTHCQLVSEQLVDERVFVE